jgi:hypothetical protein
MAGAGDSQRAEEVVAMRLIGVLSGLVLALAMAVPVASGGNPGTVSQTQTWQGLSETQPGVNPCTGHPVSVSLVSNGVMHVTFFSNSDEYWFTITDTSDFTFSEAGVTYTGHGTFWDNSNWNERNQNSTLTFDARGVGSDGSHVSISEKAHFTLNAIGVVTVAFDLVGGTCR